MSDSDSMITSYNGYPIFCFLGYDSPEHGRVYEHFLRADENMKTELSFTEFNDILKMFRDSDKFIDFQMYIALDYRHTISIYADHDMLNNGYCEPEVRIIEINLYECF